MNLVCLFGVFLFSFFFAWLKRNSDYVIKIIHSHAAFRHIATSYQHLWPLCNERDYAYPVARDAKWLSSMCERWCESPTCNEQISNLRHFASFPLEFRIKYARSEHYDDASLPRKRKKNVISDFYSVLECLRRVPQIDSHTAAMTETAAADREKRAAMMTLKSKWFVFAIAIQLHTLGEHIYGRHCQQPRRAEPQH